MACAILSGAVFLLAASLCAMPVSATHAIVGAVLGVTLAGVGAACVRWQGLATIAASWLLSPILAGLMSAVCFWTLRLVILQARLPCHPPTALLHPGRRTRAQQGVQAQHPLQRALRAVPLLAGASAAVVSCLVALTMQASHGLPLWTAPVAASGAFLACAAAAQAFAVPHIRRSVPTQPSAPDKAAGSGPSAHLAAPGPAPAAALRPL